MPVSYGGAHIDGKRLLTDSEMDDSRTSPHRYIGYIPLTRNIWHGPVHIKHACAMHVQIAPLLYFSLHALLKFHPHEQQRDQTHSKWMPMTYQWMDYMPVTFGWHELAGGYGEALYVCYGPVPPLFRIAHLYGDFSTMPDTTHTHFGCWHWCRHTSSLLH